MCKLMRLVYDGIAEDIKLDLSYMENYDYKFISDYSDFVITDYLQNKKCQT